jgi:hypothetical protein
VRGVSILTESPAGDFLSGFATDAVTPPFILLSALLHALFVSELVCTLREHSGFKNKNFSQSADERPSRRA